MSTPGPLIDAELAAFIQGPVSVFLGTADTLGTPDATRITGLVALDANRLRVLISPEATTALANAVVGARIAVLVTDITTYRSVQWRGRVVVTGEARSSGDLVLVDHHVATFAEASPVVGLDPAQAWRMFPVESIPLTVELDEIFDQTPGPTAGRSLQGTP